MDETITPVKQPLRKVPIAIKPKLKVELARLEKLGIIKPVDEPTDWVSSLVLVKKPNGKLRICIDPKPLNKALKQSHYPLAVIDDILPELSQAKVFSVGDVKNGFWHVELDNESSYFTNIWNTVWKIPVARCPLEFRLLRNTSKDALTKL